MTTTQTDYQKQGTDFLESTGTTFKATYLRAGKYFADDKEKRDIYEIELSRKGRSYTFNFGQSINNSGEYLLKDARLKAEFGKPFASANEIKGLRARLGAMEVQANCPKNPNYSKPTPYDVFTCLTKSDPGTFEDFCSDFGYDTDSRKAEKIYMAVQNEYTKLCTIFDEGELQQMAEIQ